ncbi:hypothetical protein COCVIDRAFT_13750 [Bipolaris victoriae FI3]|uniref:Jacalin-type lectin domain-containing protein n=1 Tax=Bipolaris victoriae (strain FI3) TaxID=930091 RepID=W7ERT5_BIPV3|nr:hypothetical protein COCVIDRAFT_13750 [Bipolaris victoriae FI3]
MSADNNKGEGIAQPVTTLGDGYNSFRQSAMPSQIHVGNMNPVSASISTNVYVCLTMEQTLSALDMSAGIGASISWGSFQARRNWAHSMQTTTSSVTILVVASKITGGNSLATAIGPDPAPTDALDLYTRGGDSYISSISMGGQSMAAYNFVAYNESTYNSVVAQADSDFSVWGGSFDADFAVKIDNIRQRTNTTYSFRQSGVGFSTALPTHDTFVKWVLGFGNLELDSPTILEFSTQSYSTLKRCPTDFGTINDYRQQWDGDNDIDPAKGLSSIVVQAQSIIQIIRDTRQLYDFYGCLPVDPRLTTTNVSLQKILAQLLDWRTKVSKAPTTPGVPLLVYQSTDLEYPVAQWGLAVSSPVSITVRSGDSIDNIDTWYFMQLGDQHDYSVAHGGGGGDKNESMDLGPGDTFLSGFSEWWWGDDSLKSIKIATVSNPGGKIMGRGDTSIWRGYTRRANTCCVGFAGASDDYLRSLAIQYVKFLPCSWRNPSSVYIGSNRPRLGHPVRETVDIKRFVKDFLVARWPIDQQIYQQKGGWEGWLQVELANKWLNDYGYTWKPERERHVYANLPSAAADLTPTKASSISHVIELKTGGEYRDDANGNNLFSSIADDIRKIATGGVIADLGRTVLFTIGVCVRQDIATKYGANYAWATAYPRPQMARVPMTETPGPDGTWNFELYMWIAKYQNYTEDGKLFDHFVPIPISDSDGFAEKS